MNVAVRTAGQQGEKLGKIIQKFYKEAQLKAYVDLSADKIGGNLGDVPIISLFKLIDLYKKGEIDKVVISSAFYSMDYADRHMIEQFLDELTDVGMNSQDILISNFVPMNWSKERKNKFEFDFVEYERFYHLRYLEIPLAFHCNLNCKACSHFSPLIEKEFPVFEQVQSDFYQLKKYITHIHRIRLLGGEPLLNKELSRYIELVRHVYPDTDLRIVTNGILLKQLSEDDLSCIRDNDVIIDVSVYPVMRQKYDELLCWMKKNKIKSQLFYFSEFAPTFCAEKKEYPFQHTDKTCLYSYMTEGTISTCILMHDTKYYNQYFGEKLPAAEGMIDLYDPELTPRRLLDKLKQPYPLCDYCEMYKHMSPQLSELYHQDIDVEWGMYSGQNVPCKEDWICKGE